MKKGFRFLWFLVIVGSVISVIYVLFLQIEEVRKPRALRQSSPVVSSSPVTPVNKGILPFDGDKPHSSGAVSFRYEKSEGILYYHDGGTVVGSYRLTGALPQTSGRYTQSLLFVLREDQACRKVGVLQDREVCARSIAVLTGDGLPALIIVEQEALNHPRNSQLELTGAPTSLIEGFYARGLLRSFSLEVE